jgi:MraZ protein
MAGTEDPKAAFREGQVSSSLQIQNIARSVDELAVDDKGRVMVPQSRQFLLGPAFQIFRDPRGCLLLMENSKYIQFVEKIIGDQFDPLGLVSPELSVLQDYVLSEAVDGKIDPQNRMVVPLRLRSWAHIKEKIYLRGKGHVVELWSKEVYDAYAKMSDEQRLTDDVVKYTAAIKELFAKPVQLHLAGGGSE